MPNARCDVLGHKFWARGYFVTTVGRDEEVIRAYIRNQELADQQLGAEDLSRPKIQSIVLTSLKTAFGGSQSNLQLCWRLLALLSQSEVVAFSHSLGPSRHIAPPRDLGR